MISNRIEEARLKKGVSMRQAAADMGFPYTTYVNYEKGISETNSENLVKIALYYNVTADFLIGVSTSSEFIDINPLKKKKYPLIGAVACGEPIVSESNEIFNFDVIDADFALRCKGDSMTGAGIDDGDIVLIKQCPEVENGEIAAVAVDLDGECTLKKVYYDREKARITLMPCNPSYEPIIIEGPALEDVRILGRAVVCVSRV